MTSSSIDDALDVRYRCVETTTRRDEDSNARETSTVATRDFERARALMARVGRRGARDARTIVEDASTGDGLARTIAAAAKRGMERGEDCATIFARGAGDDDADAARAVREMGAVAMVVDAMVVDVMVAVEVEEVVVAVAVVMAKIVVIMVVVETV